MTAPRMSRPAVSTPRLADTSGFPARTTPVSLGLHSMGAAALLLLSTAPVLITTPQVRPRKDIAEVELPVPLQLNSPVTSPSPGGQPSSDGGTGASAGPASQASPAAAAPAPRATLPVTYEGPRHILSDSPAPDNPVQTILQPDLDQPERLPAPILARSVIHRAAAEAPPAVVSPMLNLAVKSVELPIPTPSVHPVPVFRGTQVDTVSLTDATTAIDAVKLPVLVTHGPSYEAQHTPPIPRRSPDPAASPVPSHTIANGAAKPVHAADGLDERNLLVVNAVEPPDSLPLTTLPALEIHGRFEVVSKSAPAAQPAAVQGNGNPTATGSSPDTHETASLTTGSNVNGKQMTRGGVGSGHADSSADTSGSGTHSGDGLHAGSGGGTGGNHSGPGSGGSGTSLTASTGSGSRGMGGSGSSPFANVTVEGSGNGNGVGRMPASGTPTVVKVFPSHQSYGMTIVSSGSSAGAIRDFGVFRDGPAYTVYLDVSRLGIAGTHWSMQYGATRDVRLAHPGMMLKPPYAETQTLPRLPAPLVHSNLGRMIVVQAMLTSNGTLESMRVLQSPNPAFDGRMIECLTRWTFEGAMFGTEHVPVKVLLGIPIAAAMSAEETATTNAPAAQ